MTGSHDWIDHSKVIVGKGQSPIANFEALELLSQIWHLKVFPSAMTLDVTCVLPSERHHMLPSMQFWSTKYIRHLDPLH